MVHFELSRVSHPTMKILLTFDLSVVVDCATQRHICCSLWGDGGVCVCFLNWMILSKVSGSGTCGQWRIMSLCGGHFVFWILEYGWEDRHGWRRQGMALFPHRERQGIQQGQTEGTGAAGG